MTYRCNLCATTSCAYYGQDRNAHQCARWTGDSHQFVEGGVRNLMAELAAEKGIGVTRGSEGEIIIKAQKGKEDVR